MKIRINKFLAQSGVASRRAVDKLIEEKRVKIKINDRFVVAKVGDKIDPEKVTIFVDMKPIEIKSDLVYYALNKPIGYISSVREEHADKLVTDLVPSEPRVYPVGRLDKNSHGLMLLTNDGELANKLIHPKFEHEKEYIIKVKTSKLKFQKNPKIQISNFKAIISKLHRGVKLEEGLANADKIEIMNIDDMRNIGDIKIVLHQGWKRQIRRMCERIGLEVIDLKRTRIAKLELGNLKEGAFKEIRKSEII